jgi:FliI/YscN family ATPase
MAEVPIHAAPPDPMKRRRVASALPVGVRALDGLLTVGEGQRLGIFAAAGGGKSTLLGMLARSTAADVNVIALVGERGREVRDFIEESLGDAGLRRSVVVVATSDQPSLVRLKSAHVATAIAEHFRDHGRRVLLIMDSITRFARAQREVGLAVGEPPARAGFPPSVFATLPRLLERAGNSDRGSITAFYTVLVEGDDLTEPVADEARSILDGHVILSRDLAARAHYPAIDVLRSASRVMPAVVSAAHLRAAQRVRELVAVYERHRDLVLLGAYKRGTDARVDEALDRWEGIEAFLRQGTHEPCGFEETIARLARAGGTA